MVQISHENPAYFEGFEMTDPRLYVIPSGHTLCKDTVHGFLRLLSGQKLRTYPFALSVVEGLRNSFHTVEWERGIFPDVGLVRNLN